MTKKSVLNPVLQSWNTLNAAIREATEDGCLALMKEETKGRNRRQFLLRIHSRLNRVRADRERAELLEATS